MKKNLFLFVFAFAALAAHATHTAEELVEDAPHPAHIAKAGEIEASASAEGVLRAVHAELIVAGTLFGVGQDFVGLVQFLEAGLGVFVVGVQVGVTFLRQLPVSLFDVVLAGVLRNAQHLIIISFCCRSQLSHLSARMRRDEIEITDCFIRRKGAPFSGRALPCGSDKFVIIRRCRRRCRIRRRSGRG